uniref:Pyrin domain-containing protein n=1 Tax=Seriola lalandi dorsalis TaxID=1841481 RepID=A0A3B4XJ80_SERLL
MAGKKTVRIIIAETLEDLSKAKFDKFVHHLLDRREDPRVKCNSVEGKDYLGVTDVLVSTYTETGAPRVVCELLREIRFHVISAPGILKSKHGKQNTAFAKQHPVSQAFMSYQFREKLLW